MFRKLTRTGPASTTMALPADWIKEHQLAPGSDVRVDRVADGLRITPIATTERSAITIQHDSITIADILTKLYTEHYTHIAIENPPKPLTPLTVLISQYPGFTIVDSSVDRVNIQRTLTSAGTNSRAILLRAFRLIHDGLSSNPPKFDREASNLLFLLALEQYEPHIVSRLQELLRIMPSDAPYYDNAYAHMVRLLAEVIAQYTSFDNGRAQSIAQQAKEMEEIVDRGFVRTKNPLLLSNALHAARLCTQIHQIIVQEQSMEVLQRAKERAKKKKYTVGVCLVDKSNPFWTTEVPNGLLAEAENADIELLFDAPLVDSSFDEQHEIIKRFLEEKVDALIVVPLDPIAFEVTFKKYVEAGIPIIAIDSEIGGQDLPHYFVGFDNYAGGRMVAEFVNNKVKKKASVVLIEGRINTTAIQRLHGFTESLRKDCSLHTLRADYVESIAYEKLLAYAKDHKVDAVFAASDNMAQGAIKALDQLKQHALICGFDCTDEGLRSLKEGKQACDVNTHPRKLGSIAMQLCQAILAGKQVAERTIYDIELVTTKTN